VHISASPPPLIPLGKNEEIILPIEKEAKFLLIERRKKVKSLPFVKI
jgi:hypothetical protein